MTGPSHDDGMHSWTGLTAWQVVVQSAACHPDWPASMHAWYLVNEEPFAAGYVELLPIESWLTDPTHAGYIGRAVDVTVGDADRRAAGGA